MSGIVDLEGLLNICLSRNLPFYAYRKAGCEPVLGIDLHGCRQTSLNCLSTLANGYLVMPFTMTSASKGFFIRNDIRLKGWSPACCDEVLSKLSSAKGLEVTSKASAGQQTKGLTKEEYFSKIEDAINSINNKRFSKVVFSRTETLESATATDLPAVFKKLCNAYPDAYVSIFRDLDNNIWLGATPELLLQRHGGIIKTMALAGTRQSGCTLPWDAKNIEEQAFVSNYIADILHSHCAALSRGPLQTVNAGHIEHLLSTFSAELIGADISELIGDLHPTPAVCGIPKPEAMNFLLVNEGYDREYYSGFHGEITSDKSFAFFVNLRCAKVDGHSSVFYAGGGITSRSIPRKEWEETQMKIETLKKFFINANDV